LFGNFGFYWQFMGDYPGGRKRDVLSNDAGMAGARTNGETK
jgi:hypothetical protein